MHSLCPITCSFRLQKVAADSDYGVTPIPDDIRIDVCTTHSPRFTAHIAITSTLHRDDCLGGWV